MLVALLNTNRTQVYRLPFHSTNSWYKDHRNPPTNGTACCFKSRVHCCSVQVVLNKCFLLNPERKIGQIRLVVFKKNAPIPKNDVTEPKATLL